MTHGDPSGGGGMRAGNGNNGRQTPVMDSGGEDSSAQNTPMSSKMGKLMSVKVLMLDDSITVFQVQVRILLQMTSVKSARSSIQFKCSH